jgi:hypothetical protein
MLGLFISPPLKAPAAGNEPLDQRRVGARTRTLAQLVIGWEVGTMTGPRMLRPCRRIATNSAAAPSPAAAWRHIVFG